MEQIKVRHAISIGLLFSIGSLIISLGMNNTKTYQTLIISYVLSIGILLMYQKLLIKYPNMNIFEIIKSKYNNIFGNVIITIYLILLIYNSITIIYSFIDFITTINQSDFLSKELIMLINLLLLGYVLKNSLINISRFSQVTCIIILIMILLLFISSFTDIDFSNMLPILYIRDNKTNTNIFNFIVQPFFEMTLLFNVFCKIKTNQKHKKNIFIIISTISLLILLLISIESICLLGADYSSYLNYPYYSAISCINMYKIVIKIESLSLIIVYFTSFIKLVFIVYTIILGFNYLFKIKKKYYFPFLTLIHVLSLVAFNNIYELHKINNYYYILLFIIVIIIPLLIFSKKNENKNIM